MNDSVKFIFRTLLKVPIIILVSYFIFNIFAFAFTYFRLLGFSYVAMQTVVENNFIPPEEAQTLQNYLDSLETSIVSNLQVGCDTNTSNDAASGGAAMDLDGGENVRVQYGTPVTVTVSARYTWVFPLVNTMATGPDDSAHADGLQYNENSNNNIVISYTVPGLKYYPDLS